MSRRFLPFCLCLVLTLVLGSTRSASAADYYVNATMGHDSYDGLAPAWDGVHGPKATIQAGIDAASDTDTVFVLDGTYTGDGNRDLDFGGKAITLISEHGPDTCIIDCEGSPRGFHFRSGEGADSVIDGFRISNATSSGVHCRYSSPTITRCIIADNSSSYGGGISCYSASPTISNCLIRHNSATRGGGIYCDNHSAPLIINCTVVENSAYSGGGICTRSTTRYPTISMCIVWGNKPQQMSAEREPLPVLAYCDVQGGTGQPWFDPATCLDTDPLLTPDGHLRAGSPCIDWSPTGSPADMDGEMRPFGSGYDIGADEFVDSDGDGLPDWWETIYYADTGGDPDGDGLTNLDEYDISTDPGEADTDGDGRDDGVELAEGTNPRRPDTVEKTYYVNALAGDDAYDGLAPWYDGTHGPKATIQAGIDATETGWGYTVFVADGTYTGDGNRDLDFGGKAITLLSENGPATCVVDCQGTEEERHRGFYFHSGETSASVLDGFTISNATSSGIYCSYSSPTIMNCTITGNSTRYSGGGINCWFCSPTIANCTITGNSVLDYGGGIDCYESSPMITNCTITDNSAANWGGGISCSYGSPIITNCTISGNTAGESGGGIRCSGSPTITNCIITDNSAGEEGGGVLCSSSSPTITNCTVAGNSAGERGGGICFLRGIPPMTITNTIVWGNRAGQGPQICLWGDYFGDPCTVLVRWSNVEGGRAGVFEGAKSTLDYDASNTEADPLLTPAGYLRSGSPCIDWCPDGPADDISGEARPFGSGYDIGADEFVDTDGDGLPDWWEAAYYTDADGDPDGDGLDNLGEYEHSGDPANTDTDGDGWSDSDEVSIYGTDPSDADTDGDGLSDPDEVGVYGTDPNDADTDDDAWTDGEEIAAGTDPLSPDTTIYVNGTTGDDAWDGFAPSYDGTHGPKRTILAGFDTARSNAGHVVLVADGTYSGDGNTGLWYNGKAVTVRSENGPESCIIDLQLRGGFDFFSGEGADSVLEGFTISNADWNLIRCEWSSPTIANCTLSGKSSWRDGHGVYCWNASPTVSNCTITETYGGILLENDSNATITNCTITGNTPTHSGGGIYCYNSSPTITNCTITGNTTPYHSGGGIYCRRSTPTITDCTVSGNSAGDRGGGGIFCRESIPMITNCTVSGNSAGGDGGGIYCWDGDATITNCTVTGNSSEESGGGIRCWGGSATITNCTISDNAAEYGGGVFAGFHTSGTIRNCILWGNTAQEGPQLGLSESTLTLRYCDVQGGATEAYLDEYSTLDYDASNIEADPLLTPDGRLVSRSPCVDWCPDGPADDIDGEARPFGSGYDIGADEFVDTDGDGLPDWWELAYFGSPTAARPWRDPDHDWAWNIREYEWALDPFDPDTDDDGRRDGWELWCGTNPRHPDNRQKTYYVNGTTGDDLWDGLAATYDGIHGPKRTIQAGIDATVTGWGYTVLVADGTYTGDGNGDLRFDGKAITVKSAKGADATIIDCEGSESDGHGGFVLHSWELADSVIDGFTIQNGYGEAGAGIDCYKSSPTITNCVTVDNSRFGIYCIYNSSPTIANCTVTGNAGGGIRCAGHNATIVNCTVTGNSGGSYGGIYCSGNSWTIADCTITDNSASSGSGGIHCWGVSPTITNCTITGNSGTYGGGIDCSGVSPTITNCTITGNSSRYHGGGINCSADSATITNCTITGNSAAGHGGGVFAGYDAGATMTNCILWGNTAPDGHEIGLSWATLSVRYCDVQGGAAEVYVGPDCTLDYDASNIDADPLFRDAANGDYRLQRWSPCIDAATSDGAPERDIVGARRWDVRWIPNTGGGEMPWYDIGAYEFWPGRRWGQFHPHWRKWPWHWHGPGCGSGHGKGHGHAPRGR